eukprot:305356-Pyramimonas_sp.AAC.1
MRVWGEGSISLQSLPTVMVKHQGFIKCASCGYMWSWKGREKCYSYAEPLELMAPPPWHETASQGVWETRIQTAIAGEQHDGLKEWSDRPKSRRWRKTGA